MNQQYKPHIHEYKRKEVVDVTRLFNEYPVVGILNLEGLPSANYQKIKKQLRGKVVFKFTKKSFMLKALEQIKKQNIDHLKDKLQGVPALLFTKEDPFELYKILEKSKANSPAKAGQLAPEDLSVPAGPTSFTPGPMIGEFGQLGIKTEVKEGKIHIKEDKVLVKAGQAISPKVADMLVKLGVEPMKIGLNLLLTYQDGEILTKDVLYVNEEEFMNNIRLAYQQALSLSLNISYPTPENIKLLLMKAQIESEALSKKVNIDSSLNVKEEPKPSEPKPEQISVSAPEPKQEIKKEDPSQQQVQQLPKQQPKTQAKIETSKETKIEVKSQIKENDMKMAQEKWQEIMTKTVNMEKKDEKSKEEKAFKTEEKDINKIINQLKDKKSAGKI
ncbi:MAG: 50S ribosomal protein L10 [Nanoarchaeota archaeon]